MERWLYEWTLRRADAVTTCSGALRDRFRRYFPAIERHVTVIHNGTDATQAQSADLAARRSRAPAAILCIGTYEHGKGQDVLLRAFARVAEQHAVQLTLVGRTTPFLQTLKGLALTLGIHERVAFLTDLEHAAVLKLYESADIFVCPSREEAFGIVLLEAGAMGVPVVATSVGGIPEFVIDRSNGLLVPPDDVDSMAARILELIETPSLRATLAQSLHADVLREHTWPAVWARYRALLLPDG
jgi:glycosyltransferase involved in cell wall biosynthesis